MSVMQRSRIANRILSGKSLPRATRQKGLNDIILAAKGCEAEELKTMSKGWKSKLVNKILENPTANTIPQKQRKKGQNAKIIIDSGCYNDTELKEMSRSRRSQIATELLSGKNFRANIGAIASTNMSILNLAEDMTSNLHIHENNAETATRADYRNQMINHHNELLSGHIRDMQTRLRADLAINQIRTDYHNRIQKNYRNQMINHHNELLSGHIRAINAKRLLLNKTKNSQT